MEPKGELNNETEILYRNPYVHPPRNIPHSCRPDKDVTFRVTDGRENSLGATWLPAGCKTAHRAC
jgi:hypothetical protein